METRCNFSIDKDILYNCDTPVTTGVGNIGYIYNYYDVDRDTIEKEEQNPQILTSFPLVKGKKGYKIFIPGKTPFTGTTTSLAEGTYRNGFTKTVNIVILDAGPDVVNDIINPLANGLFIVVLENKFQGTDKKNTFQVFGLELGLAASAIESDKYSEDTQGGTSVTLTETNAPTFAHFIFNESVTATRQMLEATLTTI